MKFVKSPYFYVPATIVVIAFLILLYRYLNCDGDCSFWTGKPTEIVSSPNPTPNPQPKPKTVKGDAYNVVVSNTKGATLYVENNGVMTATTNVIPYNTKVNATLHSTATGIWYETDKGFLDANDVSLKNQSPH